MTDRGHAEEFFGYSIDLVRVILIFVFVTFASSSFGDDRSGNAVKRVDVAERRENLKVCLTGQYPSLCNKAMLSSKESKRVNLAERKVSNKSQSQAPAARVRRRSASSYTIDKAINDETFIINGEVFKAQTYCLGWDDGDEVVFIEGSEFGACASAKLFNKDRDEVCDVWCE